MNKNKFEKIIKAIPKMDIISLLTTLIGTIIVLITLPIYAGLGWIIASYWCIGVYTMKHGEKIIIIIAEPESEDQGG